MVTAVQATVATACTLAKCMGGEISERIGDALVEFGVCSLGERRLSSFDEKDYARPENEHVRPRSRW